MMSKYPGRPFKKFGWKTFPGRYLVLPELLCFFTICFEIIRSDFQIVSHKRYDDSNKVEYDYNQQGDLLYIASSQNTYTYELMAMK